jgi:hypothetical protein
MKDLCSTFATTRGMDSKKKSSVFAIQFITAGSYAVSEVDAPALLARRRTSHF